MPKASVVILSHRPAMLPEALASALAQTEADIQIAVQYCREAWGEKLNAMVNVTIAPHVVILCDDDLIAPTFVEECLKVMAKGADIVYTDQYVFADGQAPSDGHHFRIHGDQFSDDQCYWMQHKPEDFRMGVSLPMTCMIRRTWWNRMVGYDPEMPHADTEFWYRSVLNGARTAYIPKPLFWYREHPEQLSKTNDMMQPALRAFHIKHFQQFGCIPNTAVFGPDRVVGIRVVPPEQRLAYAATHDLTT